MELGHQPVGDRVNALITFSVAWVVANHFVIVSDAVLVAKWGHLGVLDGGQGVNDIGEAADAEAHVGPHLARQECHLNGLVVVAVRHLVNDVHGVHVGVDHPVQRLEEVQDNSVVL